MSRLYHEQDLIADIMRTLREGGLSPNEVVLSGSAAMVAYGIDRGKQIGDIDLFVTTAAWFMLRETGSFGTYITHTNDSRRRHDPPYLYKLVPWGLEGKDVIEINVFFEWRTRDHANISVKELFERANPVQNFGLCADMRWLLEWKEAADREKDQDDMPLIKKLLGE